VPESDNLRRGNDARTDLYEVWYLVWNDPRTGQGFWLRYITEPGRGELWFARFDPARPDHTFGMHKRFDRVVSTDEPFTVTIGGATLGHDRAKGELSGGGHHVTWDLRWDPAREALRIQPDLSYRFHIGDSTLVTPNPRVAMHGTLVVDGETLPLAGAVLGQSHVVGAKHLYGWAWAQCGELEGAHEPLLEMVAARLHRRGLTSPPLLMLVLDVDGERLRFNQFRHLARNRASWRTGHVAFSAWSPRVRVEGELSCSPGAMVQAEYEDPDGARLYCANTEIGDARVDLYRRGLTGWRHDRTLISRGRAHFEIGARELDPAITREHVLV
jgi:hypothetical protein